MSGMSSPGEYCIDLRSMEGKTFPEKDCQDPHQAPGDDDVGEEVRSKDDPLKEKAAQTIPMAPRYIGIYFGFRKTMRVSKANALAATPEMNEQLRMH